MKKGILRYRYTDCIFLIIWWIQYLPKTKVLIICGLGLKKKKEKRKCRLFQPLSPSDLMIMEKSMQNDMRDNHGIEHINVSPPISHNFSPIELSIEFKHPKFDMVPPYNVWSSSARQFLRLKFQWQEARDSNCELYWSLEFSIDQITPKPSTITNGQIFLT